MVSGLPRTDGSKLQNSPNFLESREKSHRFRFGELDTQIYAGFGETFPNLIRFDAFDSIVFVERENFAGMTKLELLFLSGNKIEFLPEDVFWDLTSLERLEFYSNKIEKIPENIFKNLRKLKSLSFSFNKIEHLPKSLFVNNLEIEYLVAGNNPLKTIGVDFLKLPNLNSLNLENSNCIDFEAWNKMKIPEAQQRIHQNCTLVNW